MLRPAESTATIHRAASSARPTAAMANGGPIRPKPGPPLAELDFSDPAYRRFKLSAEAVEDHDRHLEFWDGATSTAIEVRDVSPYHERPSHRLAALAERIALVRGHPITCFGTMSLVLPETPWRAKRLMEADQSLYLHPRRTNLVGPSSMVVGEHHYPDVVLEVDLSTDVRRNKFALYEAWGFPELWVDVPDQAPRPRKPRGTTIYLREGRVLKEAGESRAFPGWRAKDIHLALNEERMSARTVANLERLGATLGERIGTGPDDDPMLRTLRQKARLEGRATGREEGLEAGREEGLEAGRLAGLREALGSELERRASMIRYVMIARGLDVAADFPLREAGFAEADLEQLMAAATICQSEADFLARVPGMGPA